MRGHGDRSPVPFEPGEQLELLAVEVAKQVVDRAGDLRHACVSVGSLLIPWGMRALVLGG